MVMRNVSIIIANKNNLKVIVSSFKTLLVSLQEKGISLPFGCKYGGCISCAAKLIEGNVKQTNNVALNNYQINLGYILLCVSKPITNCIIEVGVESHDKLYRNPFKKPLKDDELKPYLVKELKSKRRNHD